MMKLLSVMVAIVVGSCSVVPTDNSTLEDLLNKKRTNDQCDKSLEAYARSLTCGAEIIDLAKMQVEVGAVMTNAETGDIVLGVKIFPGFVSLHQHPGQLLTPVSSPFFTTVRILPCDAEKFMPTLKSILKTIRTKDTATMAEIVGVVYFSPAQTPDKTDIRSCLDGMAERPSWEKSQGKVQINPLRSIKLL